MKICIHPMTCTSCCENKKIEDFPINKKSKYGRQRQCKRCKADWMKADRIKKPEHYRGIDLIGNYGITPTQYNAILRDQNGVCAICYKPETRKRGWLHVDHNHTTGEVRGLLCGNCNTGIGIFFEDSNVLQSAIKYILR